MPSSDSRTADVNHDTVGESRSAAELAVRRYVPNSLRPDQWAAISEFTVDIAVRLGASHPKRAIESMRTLSQFIHWARTQGLPLDVELIFDPDTVEGYIAGGCPHLAVTTLERDRQPLPWQSTAWAKSWNRRSRIEGLNGLARYLDVNLNRGFIRCRGRAATGLLTAFALLGMNVRRLRKWPTTREFDDPWRLVLDEQPDDRPHDHYYRTDRRARSPGERP